MSWDIGFDADLESPFGTRAETMEVLSAALPGVVWEDSGWGVLEGADSSIEVNLGSEEPVLHFMLHVRGGGGAFDALQTMCKKTGWVGVDMGTGVPLDLEDDTQPSTFLRDFVPFCGEKRFQRFILELLDECEETGQLTKWQRSLLEEYCAACGITEVPSLEQVRGYLELGRLW